MTELELQLTRALEQQGQAYEQQFTELSEKLNSLRDSGAEFKLMKVLEQQAQVYEHQAREYERQFRELHESLSSLATDTGQKEPKRITEPLRELESTKICLGCRHGKYSKRENSNNQKVYWDFSCLIDHSQGQSVEECTHYEK